MPHVGACAAGLKMVSIDTGPARDTSAVVEELGNRSPCDGVWRTAGASCGCGRAKKASNVRSCALECSISQDPSAAQGVAQVSSPRGVVFWLRRTMGGEQNAATRRLAAKRQRSVDEASTKRQRSVNDALMRDLHTHSPPNPTHLTGISVHGQGSTACVAGHAHATQPGAPSCIRTSRPWRARSWLYSPPHFQGETIPKKCIFCLVGSLIDIVALPISRVK